MQAILNRVRNLSFNEWAHVALIAEFAFIGSMLARQPLHFHFYPQGELSYGTFSGGFGDPLPSNGSIVNAPDFSKINEYQPSGTVTYKNESKYSDTPFKPGSIINDYSQPLANGGTVYSPDTTHPIKK